MTTPSNLNYNAPQDSPDRKGIAEAQKQTHPKDPQADIREAMAQAFVNSMQPKFGETPPITNLGWEEVHFPTLAKEILALFQAREQQLLSELLGAKRTLIEARVDGEDWGVEAIPVEAIEKYREGL